MSINSIETAIAYTGELDKMFAQKSATGFFADNNLTAKFVGGKTVMIPDVEFQGLADYDRNTGFSRGAIRVANTSYTMKMDRARSLQIDREDMDESGIANLAGKILGEYVRTKVIPECDAYVLSKLAGLAQSRGNTVEADFEKPFKTLVKLIQKVQSVVGYDEELVAFVDSIMYAQLQNSEEFSRFITVSEFKQGEINLKVNSLNGVAIIPVVNERMKTAYDFVANEAGGFTPAENAKEILMLVCPKKGAHLVKKTENMRIFSPEQNLDADAYKFDYRIYYDVFVKKSGLDAVWASFSPEIKIDEIYDYGGNFPVTASNVNITVNVENADTMEYGYQWYKCDENGENGVAIPGETSATMVLNGPDYEVDDLLHFYVVVSLYDSIFKKSEVVTLLISR
ncbi:MAG: hypothetical protein IJX79_00765 [Clostridia bacterium]|nr:hypothetical protein [Clostridia bacterium]